MKIIFVFCMILVANFYLAAQNPVSAQDTTLAGQVLGEVSDTVQVADFFESDDVLKATLKYDITSFIKNKTKGEYLDAELQIFYDENNPVTKNIRIKARGNFRRGQCTFPPLFLNFKTDKPDNPMYEDVKKVKIVTHCSASKESEANVLREYLAYKLYNVITERSFRVRLLDITYTDTGKKQKNYQAYGFAIEPAEIVVKRNNGVLVESLAIKGDNLVTEDADRAAMFQYMISNTDWRIKSGHNTKYMKSLSDITDKLITLPYDFDFSGFVGASYTFPQEWSHTESIYERDYLGYCRDNDGDYQKIIDLYLSKEKEVMQTVAGFKYLSEKDKKEVEKFTAGFFEEIKDSKDFIRKLKNDCHNFDF
jgi:hypothetical protein